MADDNFSTLAIKQLTQVGDMNTRQALRLIAYWQGRLPIEDQSWRAPLRAALTNAPERKRITSRLVATDLLLNLIFGETKTRPKVKPGVQIGVVDYIEDSARKMDRLKPNEVPPDVPVRILDAQAKRLADQLKKKPARKGIGVGILLLILVLATSKKRR